MEENAAFAKKFDFRYPLLSDTERQLGLAYRACDDPGAEYAKRISYLIGPDGTIRKAYDPVDPPSHPEQVLADLG